MKKNSFSDSRLVLANGKYLVLMAALLLGGCSHLETEEEPLAEVVPPKPVEPVNWEITKQQRQAINSWELRGRLGIQTEHNGGSLDINWKQDGDDYVIRLLAPMGQGTYRIHGDKYSASIKMPNGKTRYIDQPNQMFNEALGVSLPLDALKDWVRGVPASSLKLDYAKWDDKGLLHVVRQEGWHVEMSNHFGETLPMPYKIYIDREDMPDLDIRLVLRQWMVDSQ